MKAEQDVKKVSKLAHREMALGRCDHDGEPCRHSRACMMTKVEACVLYVKRKGTYGFEMCRNCSADTGECVFRCCREYLTGEQSR